MTSTQFKKRLVAAEKVYQDWSNRFACDQLVNYIEGMQWGPNENDSNVEVLRRLQPYVVNMIEAALEQKSSTLLFTDPGFLVTPRPGNSDWNQEIAVISANKKEAFLNTVTGNPSMNFAGELGLVFLDSASHFGVMEANYAADWRNPLKDAPVRDEEGKVIEEYQVLESERLYAKRIMPWRFRVSAEQPTTLEKANWYGYYEWYSRKDLEDTEGINFPSNYVTTNYEAGFENDFQIIPTASSGASTLDGSVLAYQGMGICKVWHVWSNESKMRYLFLDGNMEELWKEPFEETSVIDLRWKLRQRGWYPRPLIYSWIPPQDEINEARDQQRNYRRRYTRKFAATRNKIDQENKEAFANGLDGTIIEVDGDPKGAIVPIDNPSEGTAIPNALLLSKDDFEVVSASSSENRNQSDRTTATQASISNQRATVRESFSQRIFAKFVGAVGRALLKIAQRKVKAPFWIQYTKDPGEDIGGEVDPSHQIFQLLNPADIQDGYDFNVNIDAINSTPAAIQEQKTAYIEFLTLVNQYPNIALDADLIRETAYRVGYKNEKIIRKMQRTVQLQQLAQEAANAQKAGGGGGGEGADNANNQAAAMAQQNEANAPAEIESQLNEQVQ